MRSAALSFFHSALILTILWLTGSSLYSEVCIRDLTKAMYAVRGCLGRRVSGIWFLVEIE